MIVVDIGESHISSDLLTMKNIKKESLSKFMDFTADYTLENDYIKLIPLAASHLTDLEILSRDPDIWIYFLEKGQGGIAFENYFIAALTQKNLNKEYPFVVFDKTKKQVAGMTRLYDYSPLPRTIKLGHTWYGKPFRGTGVNKHCKFLLFQFVFEKLLLERVGFGAYATNTVSLAALKSVGCQQEGVLKNLFPAIHGEGRVDCALFCILKEDWFGYAKGTLQEKLGQVLSEKMRK